MESTNEITEQIVVPDEANRLKLKEMRALRKKEKKAVKKLQKQKEREQKEIMLKLQPMGNNVTLITRDFADKIVKSTTVAEPCSISVSAVDFPTLGEKFRAPKTENLSIANMEKREEIDVARSGRKSSSKIELSDFMSIPTTTKQVKPSVQCVESYCGNPLDSDLPVRKKGKFREEPKSKKLSKLKQDILRDKSEHQAENEILTSIEIHPGVKNLPLYCDHVITEELDDLVKSFVLTIVQLQEKLYKRDPIKGASKRRYIVGLHEVKKYLKLNKVKIVIVATDLQVMKHDGALGDTICQIVELAKTNDVPYLFALKRRLLGVLTMKYIPVSCIAILNHEGLEGQFNTITETLLKVKNDSKHLTGTTSDTEDTNTQLLNNLMEALK